MVEANVPPVEKGSNFRMFLAGFIANLPGLSAGLSFGFSAILIPQLQQPGSQIPVTLEQGSWIASLFVIGDLLGCVVGGPIADRFGRRVAVLLDCLPLTVGWLLTWQAQTLDQLYAARAITGVGIGAGVPIASMYLREISTPELRGQLTIFMPLAANTGNLLMYIFGYLMPWRLTTLPGAFLPLLPIFLVFLLPETPVWLVSRGRRDEAEKTLCSLRGLNPEKVQQELKMMEIMEEEIRGGGDSWKYKLGMLVEKSVLMPMAILLFLFFTQSFSGSNMVGYYTVTILQMAKIPLDENIASILIAAQYLLGYLFSSIFVTRVPRRFLLFGSLLLMGLANVGAGLVLISRRKSEPESSNSSHHMEIIDADQMVGLNDLEVSDIPQPPPPSLTVTDNLLSLVPVFSCILICFGYACGLGPVPWILFGELFPSSVRGSASSITAFLRSITVFLSIKLFPSILRLCDIGGSFLICAFVCFLAIVVSYFVVPETKGMDSKQLENIYRVHPKTYSVVESSEDSSDASATCAPSATSSPSSTSATKETVAEECVVVCVENRCGAVCGRQQLVQSVHSTSSETQVFI
eukprot:GFUD01014847.1.p1 GENE.GFUD01014847.1~~GFUD01014847.1.p1  ORF type:complete len:578 (+),score=118.94 GFUD01014847.1:284-2017(+)